MLKKDWIPYVVPLVIFMVLTEASRYWPAEAHLLYIIKAITVEGLLWFWRHAYASDFSFKLTRDGCLIAIVVGLVVLALWILPDKLFPQYGIDDAFNPFSFNISQFAAYTVIAVRLFGAVVVGPRDGGIVLAVIFTSLSCESGF